MESIADAAKLRLRYLTITLIDATYLMLWLSIHLLLEYGIKRLNLSPTGELHMMVVATELTFIIAGYIVILLFTAGDIWEIKKRFWP